MFKAIGGMTRSFHLFGGEALLLPIADLEELWKVGFEKFKHNGVQTNGTLITDAHIELFKKYCVNPGISIDGPGDLNDVRWAGTLEATRKMTARSEAAIDRLLAEGITPSLIVTFHTGNCGTDEQLDRLLQWFQELSDKGIKHINCHLMESNGRVGDLALPDDRLVAVLFRLWNLVGELPALRQQMLDSILHALSGDDRQVLCTFRPCDVLNTPSCRGVEADGKPSNCGHVYKDGTIWMPAADQTWTRQVALYQTPQAEGGCQGCEFWLACFGYCPSSGGTNDWRSRSAHCGVLKQIYREAERRLLAAGIVPLSRRPDREKLEAGVFERLKAGQAISIYQMLNPPKPAKAGPAGSGSQSSRVSRPHLDHLDHLDAAKAA
jgi:uncharacterized protein